MEFDLPDLPDTDNILIPPNTIFYPPVAEVPYLDPLLLPSLEQVQGGLRDQAASSSEDDKEKSTEEVSPITPPPVLNNLPTTKETLPLSETNVATFTIPLIGEFPIPAPEIIASSVISAGAASVVTVTGSIAMQAVVNQIKKIFKKIFTKVLKKEIANRQKDPG